MDFGGQSFVITGASSGLGAALARELARRGARLTLFSPQEAEQQEVAARCRDLGGEAEAVIGDVTRTQDCQRLIERCVERTGALDCLIANAGISMWAAFEEIEDLEILRRLLEVNYLGAASCIYHALPHLRRSRGLVVAITSIQGKIPVPQHTGYVASKHALQGFCESLRMELKGSGVDVLTVLPHWLSGTDLRRRALGADGAQVGASSRRHGRDAIPVEEACLAILAAIGRRQRDLVIPGKLRALLALRALCPRVAERLIEGAVRRQT